MALLAHPTRVRKASIAARTRAPDLADQRAHRRQPAEQVLVALVGEDAPPRAPRSRASAPDPQAGKPDKHLWRITPHGAPLSAPGSRASTKTHSRTAAPCCSSCSSATTAIPPRSWPTSSASAIRPSQSSPPCVPSRPQIRRGAGDELPLMTLRQGLLGTEAQLRWAGRSSPTRACRSPLSRSHSPLHGRERRALRIDRRRVVTCFRASARLRASPPE
jgi:hypothetical protein